MTLMDVKSHFEKSEKDTFLANPLHATYLPEIPHRDICQILQQTRSIPARFQQMSGQMALLRLPQNQNLVCLIDNSHLPVRGD